MPSMTHKVLFVCVHNSARSQMAEAFLNKYGHVWFEAESAGIEPVRLNPIVVEAMEEAGIDISQNPTRGVFDLFRMGKTYDAVITVCDGASAERCPVFPGTARRIAWSFGDPSTFTGTHEQILEQTRRVRDEIKEKILQFIKEGSGPDYWLHPSDSHGQ